MKEHIIRAVLYEDMSVKWKNAEELKDCVNVHLNVHQKARQFVEVELGDFLLSDGEWILAAFEKGSDEETNHINPTAMKKVSDEEITVFRLQIPALVHNTPGKWELCFSLVTNYNPATGEHDDSYPFDAVYFSEYSSFFDDGLTVPSKENLNAIYNESTEALRSAEEALKTAKDAIIDVQEERDSAVFYIQAAQGSAVMDIQDEEQKSLTAIKEAEQALLSGVGADVEKSAIAARQSADDAERRAVAAHDAENNAVKAAGEAESAAESARETMRSVGLLLRGTQGQPTFYLKDGRLFVRIIKGSVNPYRIENGRLKMTIVKEVI